MLSTASERNGRVWSRIEILRARSRSAKPLRLYIICPPSGAAMAGPRKTLTGEFPMRQPGVQWTKRCLSLIAAAGLTTIPFLAQAASEDDPWESVNRPIFTFNDTLDTYALKPLAQG